MNGSAIDLELIKNAVQRLLFTHPDLTGEQIAHDYRPRFPSVTTKGLTITK
jgi:hypothetical protein